MAWSVAELKAVVPPVAETLTFVPATPLVWSQARKSKFAVSALMPSGTKRTRSSSRSSRDELPLTVPIAVQLVPEFVLYSQVPLLLSVA